MLGRGHCRDHHAHKWVTAEYMSAVIKKDAGDIAYGCQNKASGQ